MDAVVSLFEEVSTYLEERALLLRGDTILDATLIAASPSTQNKASKRGPEMSRTKKGKQWYFGMKAHIGVDAKSGLVHSVKTTATKAHDARLTGDPSRKTDEIIVGDKGYVSAKRTLGLCGQKAGIFFALSRAGLATAKCDIAGAPKTQPGCRACWRSPISTSRGNNYGRNPSESREMPVKQPLKQ